MLVLVKHSAHWRCLTEHQLQAGSACSKHPALETLVWAFLTQAGGSSYRRGG